MQLFPQRNYQILRSLSLSRMPLAFHQQAADELGGNLLGGAGEESLRQWIHHKFEVLLATGSSR